MTLLDVGKRLAKAGKEINLDIAGYIKAAHPRYKPDFMYRWFALTLYRGVYPNKDLPNRKVFIQRLALITLPVDALMPVKLLLSYYATSPHFAAMQVVSAEIFRTYNSFEELRGDFEHTFAKAYQPHVSLLVREHLRPLQKTLRYCADAKRSTDVCFLFADEQVRLLDDLKRLYKLDKLTSTTIWAFTRQPLNFDSYGYVFYDAKGNPVQLPELDVLHHQVKDEDISAQILPLVRKTRLAQLLL